MRQQVSAINEQRRARNEAIAREVQHRLRVVLCIACPAKGRTPFLSEVLCRLVHVGAYGGHLRSYVRGVVRLGISKLEKKETGWNLRK